MRKWLPLLLALIMLPTVAVQSAQPVEMKRYIIKVDPSYRATLEASMVRAGGRVVGQLSNVFSGIIVELPSIPILARSISRRIGFIQEVTEVSIQQTTQPNPTWALDRIDQRTLPLSSSFTYKNAGEGTTIYIVDTGIADHDDFGERVSPTGFTAINDGLGLRDCNGHGTHVASLAGGSTYGVAKNATLVSVRVFGCDGSTTSDIVIDGLEWILSQTNTNSKTQAVVNMSLGGNVDTALNAAVAQLVNSGIAVVVAAGNDNINACSASPASEATAITVASTTSQDIKSWFSNYGACVDINAPGSAILGADTPTATATQTLSGTSMASPFVAGAVATYLGFEPNATPAMVTEYITQKSTKNVLSGLTVGTPNRLLYVPPDDNPVSLSISPSNSISRSSSVTLSFNAGQTGTASFRANGREIIGCKSVATVSEIAQCTWRPSRHGNNVVEVRITPSATSISSITRRSLSLTVTPRAGNR